MKECAKAVTDHEPSSVGETLSHEVCRETWTYIGLNPDQAMGEWLKYKNDYLREMAIEALGKLGSKEQAPALARWIMDENDEIRRAAIETLGELGAKEQAPLIAEWINGENDSVRLAAVEALGKLGAKEQAPVIAKRIIVENDDFRRVAIEAFGKMGAKEQMSAISEWLGDENDVIRRTAIKALGDLGAKEQVPALAEWLGDENYHVRLAAVEALGELDAKDQAPAITERLRDEYYSVRQAAVKALVKLNAKEQAPAIAERLKDEVGYLRQATIQALGKLGTKEQVPAIVEWFKDKNENVRQAAVEALGKLGAKEQVPAIVERLRDENDEVRRAAVEALGKLGGKEQVPAIVERLRDDAFYVRRVAVEALLDLGAYELAPAITEMLKDENVHVRRAAVETLGKLGAKEQAPVIAKWLMDNNDYVRRAAIDALGRLGAKEQAPAIAERLKDENGEVRQAAVEALGDLGAKEEVPAIAEKLKDEDDNVRRAAAKTLLKLGAADAATLAFSLENPLNAPSRRAEIWALTHVLSGGAEKVDTAMRWLSDSSASQEAPDSATVNRALSDYLLFWKYPRLNASKLRKEMSDNIARIVMQAEPLGLNPQSLGEVGELMHDKDPENAEIIGQALASHKTAKIMQAVSEGLTGHLIFWALMFLAYPHNRPVRRIFFWNPWVRKLLGLGYIGFLLTSVPYFRRRMLSPFREVLLAEARLDEFEERAYFRDSVVKTPNNGFRPILKELTSLSGQVLLKGESGLGKTSFIRQHLKQSRPVAVFLPAQRCGNGVLSAIQAKLKGHVDDKRFLKSLIYRGALDIYIDGLNEAPTKVLAKISQFAEASFRSNLLLASQPIKWELPASVRTLELQPLGEARIETFLSSRPLPEDVHLDRAEYQQRVNEFLTRHFLEAVSEEVYQRMFAVLSNPLELTLIAEMLARGRTPDVFNLQQQYFNLMALDYSENNDGRNFPLSEFAEEVYDIRKQNDRMTKLRESWTTELYFLSKHRLMFKRDIEAGSGSGKQIVTRWYFRHDIFQDFFLCQAFFDSPERQNEHMGDARFRGVYFSLAHRLPLEKALDLRDRLTEYAADNSDHTVSDTYILNLKTRPDWISPYERTQPLKMALALDETQA